MTNLSNVEQTLGTLGFSKDSWSSILVSKNEDYALVQFESVAEAQNIFYHLKTFVSDEWVLDFEPLNVSCRSLGYCLLRMSVVRCTHNLLTLIMWNRR